ncbi:lipase 1-like isoform X2 [Bacillus rossius redtenbacheri]|uniref:lipase 1-like isoform X2 n=1 Tax=Bacillus rossius redtenbacheri TaxID=93214 RepID=UPI002FDD58A2
MWLNSFIILVLAVMFWRKLSEPLQDKNNEVAFLNTSSLVRRHGYPVETHEVTTADGYRLTLHRIPGGGRPVLLLHGFLQSSASFLLGDPGHSLGYILADAGFDVWLGNWRGNFYSQKHSNKFISRQEFWNFSWHEMGVHDLPAFIDKILHETGRPQLSLVGFSMGAAAFLVLASQKPQYNDKVSASVWVAPAAFLQHTSTSFMGYFFTGAQALQSLLAAVDIFQVLPRYSVWGKLFLMLCANDRVTNSVCTAIYSLIGGHNPSNLNKSVLATAYGHDPSGTSMKTAAHYGQSVQSGRFRQYDYGPGNMLHYGQSQPPDYDLARITAPVSIFYGGADTVTHPQDVENLYSKLVGSKSRNLHLLKNYTHLDFTCGMDAHRRLYPRIVSILNTH